MKRYLLLLLFLVCLVQVNAQCDITNPRIQTNFITTDLSTGNCLINFDLQFDQQGNRGYKWSMIYFWTDADYKASTYNRVTLYGSSNNSIPASALVDNSKALASVLVNNTQSVTEAQYPYLPNPASFKPGLSFSIGTSTLAGYVTYAIHNITVSIPGGCNQTIQLHTDLFGLQSAGAKSSQCQNLDGLTFTLNTVAISAYKVCSDPRYLNLAITTTTTTSFDVYYEVYQSDGDASFEPGSGDQVVKTLSGPYSISSAEGYSDPQVAFSGNNTLGESSDYWVQATAASMVPVFKFVPNTCNPLPVRLSSFTAARNKQTAALKWETATEINNKGFYVQRNTKGVWETLAFVPSQADGGNSYGPLAYTYSDLNEEKGVSQYRLQQVDIDGKATYSPVRSVRGIGQLARTIVYPNPSSTGKINVVFEDQGLKEIVVSDMSGRVVRRYRSAVNNQVIEGLERGMYHIRITDLSSAATTVEKVIIK